MTSPRASLLYAARRWPSGGIAQIIASVETSLGGAGSRFPETRWSRILASRGEGLDALARAYWRPIYAALRRFHRLPVEEAKDATQEFFATLIARDALAGLAQGRGRFRAFLKTALANFMRDRHRVATAQKRGGGAAALDVDGLEALIADPGAPPPDRAFDDEWRRTVLESAAELLRERLERAGRGAVWKVFQSIAPEDGTAPSYREAAAALGLTEDQVRNHLHAARREFREAVLDVLRESVAGPDDLEGELNDLFAR
jgi:RNA polymerase sigma-70 factor (ECF subfamily)